jgi:hypothetical protein
VSKHDQLHRVGDRFEWRCYYCRRPTWCGTCKPDKAKQFRATRDHFVPKASGGKGGPNIVLACFNCNHMKADRFIKAVPRKPRTDGCYANQKSRRPRKAFGTEHLAEMMCRAVAEQYGRELVPYRCNRCPDWHVAPPKSASLTKARVAA